MRVARAWGLHPDQIATTDLRTYRVMIDQLNAEDEEARRADS